MTLGVTPPISTQKPTPEEQLKTESLVKYLQDVGLFESQEEAQKRFDPSVLKRPELLF